MILGENAAATTKRRNRGRELLGKRPHGSARMLSATAGHDHGSLGGHEQLGRRRNLAG